MEVKVVSTGGIAGERKEIGPIDTDRVPGGDRIEIQVEEIGFWEMPERLPVEHPIRDGYTHEVTITVERRRHVVSFADSSSGENAGIAELVSLVRQAAEGGGQARCEWSAWYNRMPGTHDEDLHVAGRCELPEGTTIRLEPGDIGIAPDPGVFALQATIERNGGYGGEPSWVGTAGPDIKHVRIQGDVNAEVDVTIAQ